MILPSHIATYVCTAWGLLSVRADGGVRADVTAYAGDRILLLHGISLLYSAVEGVPAGRGGPCNPWRGGSTSITCSTLLAYGISKLVCCEKEGIVSKVSSAHHCALTFQPHVERVLLDSEIVAYPTVSDW